MRHPNKERNSPARAQERGWNGGPWAPTPRHGVHWAPWLGHQGGSQGPLGRLLRDTQAPQPHTALLACSPVSLACRIVRVPTAEVSPVDRENLQPSSLTELPA